MTWRRGPFYNAIQPPRPPRPFPYVEAIDDVWAHPPKFGGGDVSSGQGRVDPHRPLSNGARDGQDPRGQLPPGLDPRALETWGLGATNRPDSRPERVPVNTENTFFVNVFNTFFVDVFLRTDEIFCGIHGHGLPDI